MGNDELRHEVGEVLALVREQMADLAAMQKRRAELVATGAAADGLVEVTVNAHGQLVKTVIDESYLDEYEFEELADHICEAAQGAACDAARRMTEMMAPIGERRERFPSLSEFVDGAPDLRDLVSPWPQPVAAAGPRRDCGGGDGGEGSVFPMVRR